MTLRKAMKNVALAVKKQNAVHGRPSINQTKAAKRKAGEVEGRRVVNQVPAKVVEKAAESRNGPKHQRSIAGRPPTLIGVRKGQAISACSFLPCHLGSLFAESGARPFRQMGDSFLPSRSSRCLLNIPPSSGSLLPGRHKFPG